MQMMLMIIKLARLGHDNSLVHMRNKMNIMPEHRLSSHPHLVSKDGSVSVCSDVTLLQHLV